jgi:hypothetical protein
MVMVAPVAVTLCSILTPPDPAENTGPGADPVNIGKGSRAVTILRGPGKEIAAGPEGKVARVDP